MSVLRYVSEEYYFNRNPTELSVSLNEYGRHLLIFFLWDISRVARPHHFSTIQTIDYDFRFFNYQFSVVTYLATILQIIVASMKILVVMVPKVVVAWSVDGYLP